MRRPTLIDFFNKCGTSQSLLFSELADPRWLGTIAVHTTLIRIVKIVLINFPDEKDKRNESDPPP